MHCAPRLFFDFYVFAGHISHSVIDFIDVDVQARSKEVLYVYTTQ
ncbi:hypothetical protein THF1D04_30417 [Vibrio owensii]|uniref:Uncharacterized protein n=1 Tax=Vibrio owensii TaxID=696485 RepID=A0AAU9Q7Q0_9VIBR|nr:hypothetical protein THF1D04_30417 [Vibrio owensii]